MPRSAFADWHRTDNYPIQHQSPRAAIGAMAGRLLWDMQLSTIAEHPELIEGFVGAKAIVDHFLENTNLRGSEPEALSSHVQALARVHIDDDEWGSTIHA